MTSNHIRADSGCSGQLDNANSNFLRKYSLEICCLLFNMANSNALIVVPYFYMDRICRVTKNLSSEECRNLTSGFYEQDERQLEVTASQYSIYQNVVENAFPILFSFFLGSWSDKNGSKPILVTSLVGFVVSSLFYTMFSLLPNISPEYILFSSVPIALGGGLTALIISSVSYMTRQVPKSQRSFRMSVLTVCFDGGATVGYFVAEKVYRASGYTEVFILSVTLYGLAALTAIFLISEKKPETVMIDSSCSGQCAELFDVAAVKDTVVTCFKKRQNNTHKCVVVLILCVTLQYLSYLSRNYLYLYTRNKFSWGFEEYSDFSIVTSLFNNIGGLVMTLIAINLLHLTDVVLGLITIVSNLGGFLVMIVATSGWHMYIASALQMCGAITTAVMRSILSKLVETEEHGKLFSFVTCTEFAMPFVAGSVYGLIYMNAATSLPNALFFLPVGIQSLIILSYVYLHFSMKNSYLYSPLRDDNDRRTIEAEAT